MSECRESVLVVTEVPLLGIGIRALLAEEGSSFDVVEIARTHGEALQAVGLGPDILLYHVTATTAPNSVREICQHSPRTAVVLIGQEFRAEKVHEALDLGVRGIVSSTAPSQTLLDCLKACRRGRPWIDSSLGAELLSQHAVTLSHRQTELLSLLLRGLKNKEIAAEMGLSVGTVKSYLTTLFEKVGARDRFELALFGLKHAGEKPVPVDHSSYSNAKPEKEQAPSRAGWNGR